MPLFALLLLLGHAASLVPRLSQARTLPRALAPRASVDEMSYRELQKACKAAGRKAEAVAILAAALDLVPANREISKALAKYA